MKPEKVVFLPGLILITMLLGGCVKSNNTLESPTRQSPTAFSTRSVTHALTATHTSAPTDFPPLTKTLTPTPTHRPTHSPTPTVVPTLSVEDARLRLLELLADNGNCRLPCLWGIIPGESTYQYAYTQLALLNNISDRTSFIPGLGEVQPRYIEGDLTIDIRLVYLSDNDIVNHINFEARVFKEKTKEGYGIDFVFDSEFFGQLLGIYMLPQILSEYGKPSSVLLSTLAEFPPPTFGQGHFEILILYPDLGILVHYTTEMSVVGENVVGCPAHAHVELELYPSGNGESFFELLAPTYWPETIKNNYKPLEEVTSLSLDEFYQTFRQATDECLVTPAELWPVPER